ncbi:MAG: L,D-transpeptidase family protein [Candidatus Eisenbacteria bacterium]|nr:L,D-transpeptidase family protein [Candidatus Latescibacterota bacterium]MBD3302685.1 L,D-transpeptidase family protein [Candidatus Eisenbacteria bacterium]
MPVSSDLMEDRTHPSGRIAGPRRARSSSRGSARAGLRWAIPLLGMLGVLVLLFAVPRDPAPTDLLLTAEQYLNFARESRAHLESRATFEEAEATLQRARAAMEREFGRPLFLRDYDETRSLLARAHGLIGRSIEESRAAVSQRGTRLREEIESVRERAAGIRRLLENLPPEHRTALAHVVSAESRIWAAAEGRNGADSDAALASMRAAREELDAALEQIRGLLVRYLDRRERWRRDLEETLAATRRQGGTALVVDKLNHEVHVVQGGRSVRVYPAELGPGWLERKSHEGDLATPEGRYRVVRRKSGPETRYHRALLLDYPNEEDRARFTELRRRGEVPRSARIGGLIEIHGHGGKGEDWTHGCVSLEDRDMDELFARAPVGTPVTIVGLWREPAWLEQILTGTDG